MKMIGALLKVFRNGLKMFMKRKKKNKLWRIDYKDSFTLIVIAPGRVRALESLLTPNSDYDPMEPIEEFPYHIYEPYEDDETIDLDYTDALELSRLYPKSWEKYVEEFVEIRELDFNMPQVVANMWYD